MSAKVKFGMISQLDSTKFSVPIMIEGVTEIGAISLSIPYSPLIKPISATPADNFNHQSFLFNPFAFDTYLIRCGWFGFPPVPPGKFCDIIFEVQPLFFHFTVKDCELALAGGEPLRDISYDDKFFDIKDNKPVEVLTPIELLQMAISKLST